MDGNVREVMFVSTKTMEDVPELIEKLIDLASRHSFLKKQIPKAYYDLHEAVIKLRPSAEGAATGKAGTSTSSTNTLSSGLSGRYPFAHTRTRTRSTAHATLTVLCVR